jgi:glycosyltransferase involved in cell wall biosynthesis
MTAFPTLAELVAEGVLGDPAPASELIVLVERRGDVSRVHRVVPPGSLLIDVSSGESSPTPAEPGTDVAHRADSHGELLDVVRRTGCDVLLVSDGGLLTPAVLEELRATLVDDSACATVSVDEVALAHDPGIPPPGVIAPRRGVVLVRRDHVLLALEETDLLEHDDVALIRRVADEGIVGGVLDSVDRPGFVHRAVGSGRLATTRATPPPPRSRRASRAARIVIDGRCLAQPLSGTQVQVLGLAGGLVRAGADVAVMRPGTLHPTVSSEIERLGNAVRFVQAEVVGRPDIFHRPFQVRSLHELADCLSVGERLVLTHQDMILDRTRAYAFTDDSWHDYRRTTAAALSSADEVGFFSRHAALDAASEGSLELDRATVVALGVDHLSHTGVEDTVVRPLDGRPFLLVVGNSYWHKNRLFAFRLLRRLVEAHGWDGGLVLAGGHPGRGSSLGAEQALLNDTPALRPRVADLGYVPESVQGALYRSAQLVLFPSMYEGFGLIPFEAASAGTACAYTHRASMRELLPPLGALPSFDVEEAGSFVLGLLEDEAARARVVAAITDAARPLTWDRTAAGYLQVYDRALARDPRGVSRLLLSVPPKDSRVTARESVILDIYRRRRAFRLAVDGVIRAGALGLRMARRLQRREHPGG